MNIYYPDLFELGEYNRETKLKEGSFYCIPVKSDYQLAVSKTASER